jgi:hypothetical protein
VQLRARHRELAAHVVPDIRRIIGVLFPDQPDAPPQFHDFRRVRVRT